jgi:hypothetical protein
LAEYRSIEYLKCRSGPVILKQWEDERVKLAIVAANNHYAGFGPGTVNVPCVNRCNMS